MKSNSPCIDKGDPTYNYSQEPFPNGNRINMGRYGNTAEAEIIDTAGPTGTITVNGGAVRTATTAVTLTLVASDSGGLSQMQFSNDGTTWSVAEAYSATKSWTLPADDGQKTVYVKFKDNVGNWSAPTSTVITLGTAAPVSTATPRGGSFKNAQNVTLMATDAATIYYSKNGDNPTTTSASYATPIPITVDTTLKFFAKDSTGHSEVVKAERYIIDALAPMGGTISVNGGVATAARQTVTLTLSAADPSGVTQMQFSNDGINWSDPEPYSATKSWALSAGNGAKTVYVRFADTLGNWTTATIAATIDLQITARPQDPKGLAIGGVTTSSVALQWSLNPEANVVYNIFRSRMADGIFYRVNTAPADSGNYDYASKKMRFTDIVVKDGGSYFYKIQAVLNGVASSGFSDIMGATLPTIDDYTVNIIEPSTIAAVGGTAKYIILLLPRERFQGTLNLTCMKVPSGLTYAFVLNDRRTASLAGIALPATVTLEVTAGSIAVAKEHHFDLQVQNVWESGSSDPRTIPLTLTVVANNGAGIFADLDRTEFGKGEKVRIYGAIWPPPLAERTVTPTVTPASGGNPEQRTVKTSASGKFSETVWTPTLGVGTYDLEASWRDENANSWTSEARTFVVGRGEAVLTCLRDANVKPKQGDDFTIFGKLLPADVAALTYRVVDPDGQIKDYPFFTAEDGSYRETGNFFTKKGVWKFKVYWTGNDDWIGTESEWLSIPVEVELGRAIILGGGVAEQSNTYWDVTKKLIVETYRDFKSRGFTDDMIHLMINGQLDVNYDSKIDNVVD
ncbi:MAG: chitobiase/beta-hexosaminidase C-terminal domain-containing protein, partial [Deltaproteobacteria bacterium]